jgi:hypothetical protein
MIENFVQSDLPETLKALRKEVLRVAAAPKR